MNLLEILTFRIIFKILVFRIFLNFRLSGFFSEIQAYRISFQDFRHSGCTWNLTLLILRVIRALESFRNSGLHNHFQDSCLKNLSGNLAFWIFWYFSLQNPFQEFRSSKSFWSSVLLIFPVFRFPASISRF